MFCCRCSSSLLFVLSSKSDPHFQQQLIDGGDAERKKEVDGGEMKDTEGCRYVCRRSCCRRLHHTQIFIPSSPPVYSGHPRWQRGLRHGKSVIG